MTFAHVYNKIRVGTQWLAGRGDRYPLNTDLDWGLSSSNKLDKSSAYK